MVKKLSILVTGGAGFIGSSLCEQLVMDGHQVVSVDNYSTGSYDNHIRDVVYYHINTKDINTLEFKPDLIYHLGEYSRVEQSFVDYDKVFESNVIGTRTVFEFARKHKCKIVYAGSSTKFGDIGSNSSPYAWSKANNTQLIQNYGDWFGVEYAITYFYNGFGPREIETGPYATLIAKFIRQTKSKEDLIVTLPGTQKRNFTHVRDLVRGLILVGEKGNGDGYGIGSPLQYSILEIAQLCGGNIVMGPKARGNRMYAPLLTEKTKALGWEAKESLEQYIKENI